MPIKKCSKCNAAFGCGSETSGCWCERLFITPETLDYLRKEYDNCLCPACLEQYSIKPEKNSIS